MSGSGWNWVKLAENGREVIFGLITHYVCNTYKNAFMDKKSLFSNSEKHDTNNPNITSHPP
jgi:hypothetical protein